MKKVTAFLLTAVMLCGCLFSAANLPSATAAGKGPESYTYEVIPLLEPFNEYFYVKTDNPDPNSFRFIDHDSVYVDPDAEGSGPALLQQYVYSYTGIDLFGDVIYEDPATKRVKGGYIFDSYNTDGGKIVLQTVASYDYWGEPVWQDTNVTLTLPKLYDEVDYLIKTYAKGSGFFDKLDSIQAGLDSICLYTPNYVKGKLVQKDEYWSLYRSPYVDTKYYIYSPYARTENRYLLASALYPFIHDSKGFPSVMAMVALRLDKKATYQWSSNNHYLVEITYNGVTRSYGGAGEGQGQGLTEDKLTKRFAFGDQDMNISLGSLKTLLEEYLLVDVEDDIPRDDALTWKAVNDTVGYEGAWVCMENGYTYLYKRDDNDYYEADEFGGAGHSLYWGGSLEYLTSVWVDGRHISKWSMLEPGATFADYPTHGIVLTDAVYPVITFDQKYVYDWASGMYIITYSNVRVEERTGLLTYTYFAEEDAWLSTKQDYDQENRTRAYSDYDTAAILAKEGLLDQKYADMLRLTHKQVDALHVDRNTDLEPEYGYTYNGLVEPGTPFDRSAIRTGDLSVLFADAKALAEENGLKFSLNEGNYGMCGDSVFWVYLRDSRTLIVTGTGDMVPLVRNPWDFGALPMKQLLIGEGVESLPKNVFLNSTMLETVSFPSTLKKIGRDAFSDCDKLTRVEIPAGVTIMGMNVFTWCDNLTDVYCLAAAKPAGWHDDWLGDNNAVVHWGTAMPERTTGDIDGNGVIGATDYLLLKRAVLGTYTMTAEQRAVADVNRNGQITAIDYMLLKRHVLGSYKIA